MNWVMPVGNWRFNVRDAIVHGHKAEAEGKSLKPLKLRGLERKHRAEDTPHKPEASKLEEHDNKFVNTLQIAFDALPCDELLEYAPEFVRDADRIKRSDPVYKNKKQKPLKLSRMKNQKTKTPFKRWWSKYMKIHPTYCVKARGKNCERLIMDYTCAQLFPELGDVGINADYQEWIAATNLVTTHRILVLHMQILLKRWKKLRRSKWGKHAGRILFCCVDIKSFFLSFWRKWTDCLWRACPHKPVGKTMRFLETTNTSCHSLRTLGPI